MTTRDFRRVQRGGGHVNDRGLVPALRERLRNALVSPLTHMFLHAVSVVSRAVRIPETVPPSGPPSLRKTSSSLGGGRRGRAAAAAAAGEERGEVDPAWTARRLGRRGGRRRRRRLCLGARLVSGTSRRFGFVSGEPPRPGPP